MKSFRRVALIGTGLIGGSIGLALQKSKTVRVGFDRPAVLREALRRRAVDEKAGSIAEAVADADLVILALPVGEILRVLPKISERVSTAAVITDTGSTKKEICERARELELKNFVGGHPLSGKAEGGIRNAEERLFFGRSWFLSSNGNPTALSRLKTFVKMLGAKPFAVEPAEHDRMMAAASHLPQLVSTLLAATVAELLSGRQLKHFAGPGLKDATRLAASTFSVWGDVFASNRAEIGQALERFAQKTAEVSDNSLNLETLKGQFEISNKMRKGLE